MPPFQKGRKKTGGTPEVYSPELHQLIVDALKAGCHRTTAVALARISYHTFLRWMELGETGEEPYATFFKDACEAEAQVESGGVKKILDMAGREGDWKGVAWWMERRFAKQWQAKIQLEVDTHMTVFLQRCESQLPAELYYRVLQIATGEDSGRAPLLPPAENS